MAVSTVTLSSDPHTVPRPNLHFLGLSDCLSSFQNNLTVFLFLAKAGSGVWEEEEEEEGGAPGGGGGGGEQRPPPGGGGGGGGILINGAPGGGGGGGGAEASPGIGGGGGGMPPPPPLGRPTPTSKTSTSRTSISSSSMRSEKSRSLIFRALELGWSWSQASVCLSLASGVIWVFSRFREWVSASMLYCGRTRLCCCSSASLARAAWALPPRPCSSALRELLSSLGRGWACWACWAWGTRSVMHFNSNEHCVTLL